jgi:hypothetical protein
MTNPGAAVDRRCGVPVALALAAAFALSTGVSAGLAALDRLPAGLSEHQSLVWAFQLLGFGTAALALSDRVWARWAVAGTTAAYIVVGVQLYAVLFGPGLLTTVGWFANDVHIGLLVLAECLCIRRLAGQQPC